MANPDALREYARLVFSKLEGAVTATMIHLGDRLGLFKALAEAGGPVTSAELAERVGLSERWVREWLYNQGAAGILEWTPPTEGEPNGAERFALSPEGIAVLVDDSHPAHGAGSFHRLPDQIRLAEILPESFRTGIGYPYDAHGEAGAAGIERSFAPWYRSMLVPRTLEKMDGLVSRLQSGAVVADVGCGAGVAILTMAAAYPKSEFHGYDISQHALARAEANRVAAGCTNAQFHDVRTQPLPDSPTLDFVTTFDCLHDMTRPDLIIDGIRKAMKDDGYWLLVDIKGRGSFEANATKNPMASLMYGMSVLSCMSSALSEPDGLGLGTLGLDEATARRMTSAAGFSRFRRLEVEHPANAFYEVRP